LAYIKFVNKLAFSIGVFFMEGLRNTNFKLQVLIYNLYFEKEFGGGTVFRFNKFESKSGVISVIREKGVIFKLSFNVLLIANSVNNS
jgi:hypothetical protein